MIYSSKIFKILVLSCFFVIDVNAMQTSENSKSYAVQNNYSYKVTKYPDWNKTQKTINIEVHYNGDEKSIEDVVFCYGILRYDQSIYRHRICDALRKNYSNISSDDLNAIIEGIVKDVKKISTIVFLTIKTLKKHLAGLS